MPILAIVRILIVEDDGPIADFVSRGLAAHGHQPSSVADGVDGILAARDPEIELVILDLSLPGIDGQEILPRIRADRPGLPVLVLTARDDLGSKVRALDSGADDYLTKPFALDELLARIRALTRRSDQPSSAVLRAGDLELDLHGRRATLEGTVVVLSAREFALLEYLMRHPGQVLSRQQLLGAVWEYDFDPRSNVVDVFIRYLRRKIDRQGQPSLITTLRGAGYRFDPPNDH